MYINHEILTFIRVITLGIILKRRCTQAFVGIKMKISNKHCIIFTQTFQSFYVHIVQWCSKAAFVLCPSDSKCKDALRKVKGYSDRVNALLVCLIVGFYHRQCKRVPLSTILILGESEDQWIL